MKIRLLAICAVLLSSCLEPQIERDIKSIPSSEFKIETILDDLQTPWSVSELPNEGYLITQRGGNLFFVSKAQKREIKGLPKNIFVDGQGGLLDVVIAPDFQETRDVYISYSYGNKAFNGTALLRAKFTGENLVDTEVIFKASPLKQASSHFGGKIQFLPDDTLLLTLGDGFIDREAAQDKNSHLGKIIRLRRDGSVPSDNPYVGVDNIKAHIFSMGHRNVQGIAYDSKTDSIWEHEHGPRGGDEINLIKPGQNYGWPMATYGLDYNGAKISPYKSYKGMEEPKHIWTPSIAPSGLAIYRGNLFPEWEGRALIGGLASRDLRVVNLNDKNSNNEIKLLEDLNLRIRDVRVDNEGAILVLANGLKRGSLLKITPKTLK